MALPIKRTKSNFMVGVGTVGNGAAQQLTAASFEVVKGVSIKCTAGTIYIGTSNTTAAGGYPLSVAGINEQQTVNIDDASSSGNFTLTYESQETVNIAHDANFATVKTALEALSTIGANNVEVTGGPGPSTNWVIEFINGEGCQDCEMMVGDGTNLVGGSTTVTITETVKGSTSPTMNDTIEIAIDNPNKVWVIGIGAGQTYKWLAS